MQELLETFLRLGAHILVVTEQLVDDLSEEEGQVEGNLELGYLLHCHYPIDQELLQGRTG